MKEKTVLLTGGTQGIGRATAEALAKLGAKVVLVGRDPTRIDATVKQLRAQTGNAQLHGMRADLSSQESIRTLARDYRQEHGKLDVLINNAGAIYMRRELSVDGIEMTLAVNHLAYFLLTNLLLDLLKASAPSRVVSVSSAAQRTGKIDFENLQGERKYNGISFYGQSKLANVLFSVELARRLAGTGVTSNCLHPGVVATGYGHNTPGFLKGLLQLFAPLMLTPEKGARTSVYLASAPEVEKVTGKYFAKCKERAPHRSAMDPELARQLWALSEKLTGLDLPKAKSA